MIYNYIKVKNFISQIIDNPSIVSLLEFKFVSQQDRVNDLAELNKEISRLKNPKNWETYLISLCPVDDIESEYFFNPQYDVELAYRTNTLSTINFYDPGTFKRVGLEEGLKYGHLELEVFDSIQNFRRITLNSVEKIWSVGPVDNDQLSFFVYEQFNGDLKVGEEVGG
jgi:hypothetical protein